MSGGGAVFVNLDEAVRQWAWRHYSLVASSRKQKRLLKKEQRNPGTVISLDIDWADVKFSDSTEWSRLAEDEAEPTAKNGPQTDRPRATATPQASVLFQTSFANTTGDQLSYTMRTQKTTKSSMTTQVESGFTRGYDMSVKLSSPCQVLEANAGYHREVSLLNTAGETFEEELTWGVDAEINVKAGHVADASLVVDEKRQTGTFVIATELQGTVIVTFRAMRDNNSIIMAASRDIFEVVGEHVKSEKTKTGRATLDAFVELRGADRSVIIKTRGHCKFRYGIKQQVRVCENKISNS